MTGDMWLWIALGAFLVFCCLPMLISHTSSRNPLARTHEDGGSGKER